MQMRSQPTLLLHHREVLHLVARRPTQVLPEPVHQLREVHRVQRRPPVVVPPAPAARPSPVTGPYDGSVNVRNMLGRYVRPDATGERLPHRPLLHRQPRQIRHVLAVPRRPAPPASRRHVLAPASSAASSSGSSPGAVSRSGSVVQVPALPALLHPQPAVLLRTRRALALPGRAARRRDQLRPPVTVSNTSCITGRMHTPWSRATSRSDSAVNRSGALTPHRPDPPSTGVLVACDRGTPRPRTHRRSPRGVDEVPRTASNTPQDRHAARMPATSGRASPAPGPPATAAPGTRGTPRTSSTAPPGPSRHLRPIRRRPGRRRDRADSSCAGGHHRHRPGPRTRPPPTASSASGTYPARTRIG